MVAESTAGAVIVVNKWDLVEKDAHTMPAFEAEVRHALNFLPYAPVLFISAENGQRVGKVLPTVVEVNEARYHRVGTGALNNFARDVVIAHPPPSQGGVRLKIYYASQVAVAPPTIVFFVNRPEWIHFGYERYLENRLREAFPFKGTPIRLIFRGREQEERSKL
jgi:GTP-binding protein